MRVLLADGGVLPSTSRCCRWLYCGVGCLLGARRALQLRVGALQYPLKSRKIHVAAGKNHAVVGSVPALGEAACVFAAVALHLAFRAQNVVAQGVSGKENILEFIEYQLCRRVFVALDFIAHHEALLLDLGLRVLAVEHDVEQHVDGPRQMFA